MEYVLPDDPAINAAWGPPVKRRALPATLGRPAHKPMPTLPIVRAPEPTPEEQRRRPRRQNHCLACGKAFKTLEPRFKLVYLPTGQPRVGQVSGLGIDFCETCGPLAEAALKQFFGGDSRSAQ